MDKGEHLAVINMTAAGQSGFRVPKNGTVRGVYSNVPISISYDDNGNVGALMTNVSVWEPNNGFNPAPTATLIFNAAAAASISIRFEVN